MQCNTKKRNLVLVILLLLVGLAGYWLMNKNDTTAGSVSNKGGESTSEELSFKLEEYPEEVVPIYQLSKIESFKYFVNDDPQNYAGFFDANKNYFNVVFETTATQEELLSYYRSLMTSVNDEYENSTSVEGVIGEYKVSASHYGEDTDTAYLQVYLPTSSYSKENPYFKDFPKIVEVKEDWVLHETSYGLLNQKGGEIEFTTYYTVDSEQMEALFDEYQQLYADREAFAAEVDSGTLKWTEADYEVTLVFSEDHGRVYLMMRTPMK